MGSGISLAAREVTGRPAPVPLARLKVIVRTSLDRTRQVHLPSAQFQMSSADAHIKLCNALLAADRMWEATIDTLPDAVYIFGTDKRLKKINRAGESLEQAARSFLAGCRCCDMLWGLEETGCMVDRAIASGAELEVALPAGNKP